MTVDLDKAISSVAILINYPDRFRERAALVARQLGPAAIDELATCFHSPLRPEPPGFGYEQCGLGGWMAIWQAAIFELFFHFGTDALPVLREVAFGEYDWTQGNAVEVLVRLAAAGVRREAIIAEVRQEFPKFRHEGTLYSVGPLLHHAARDPAVAAVVRELEDLPEWRSAAEELRAAGRA